MVEGDVIITESPRQFGNIKGMSDNKNNRTNTYKNIVRTGSALLNKNKINMKELWSK